MSRRGRNNINKSAAGNEKRDPGAHNGRGGNASAVSDARSDKRKKKSGAGRIVVLLVIVCAAAAAGYWWQAGHRSAGKADDVMTQLEVLVPGIGSESGGKNGAWQESLASVSIDGMDIVGALSVPALDIMAPVAAGETDEEYVAFVSGDTAPAGGGFRIEGSRSGLFRKLAALRPGDRVTFIDIYGVRCEYEVRTQYHLKNWDEGDNDLLLCYRSDSDTYFVVGCTETGD